jgi:hypothetical protein
VKAAVALAHLTDRQVLRRMNPKNTQLGRLVSRIGSRRCQENIIAFWNRHQAVAPDLWNQPFLPVRSNLIHEVA